MSLISHYINKFLNSGKNSILPAVLFGYIILSFLAGSEFLNSHSTFFHGIFYVALFINIIVLSYFNQSKPLFFMMIITLSYIYINQLKKNMGIEYLISPQYINLCLLVPLNLALFYFLPNTPLFKKRNILLLLLILLQISIFERISNPLLDIPLLNPQSESLRLSSLLLFSSLSILLFFHCSLHGGIIPTYLFFSFASIFGGFYFSSSTVALSGFFGISIITLNIGIILNTYYTTYKDTLTGLNSRHAYMINSKKLPLKYSIGIIAIDDYETLKQTFGNFDINTLTKMIAKKIKEAEASEHIYRYLDDEFVIIFKGETKNEAFEHMEKVRRSIASSEFAFKLLRKPIKLTVSGSITEKKRTDANSVEVLARAQKALQKTYKFTQNMTTKA